MKPQDLSLYFADAPELRLFESILNSWQRPAPPDRLKSLLSDEGSLIELCLNLGKRVAESRNLRSKRQLELAVICWLYDFTRANVKRGREFDFRRVLETRRADCLGYCKLFTVLGRWCGLNAGIVEVIIDNAGRAVPHTAILVKLPDGKLRLIDLWYGSQHIRHKKLGLQVKQRESWMIKDVWFKDLPGLEVTYLPDSCVDAITLYIVGNRHLKNGDLKDAVKCYSEALRLYPANPRFLYNRSIAYEKSGETAKAKADLTQAFRDEDAITRLLAREHEEVTAMIQLDYAGTDGRNRSQ